MAKVLKNKPGRPTASGTRSVSIGGDAVESNINTGDNYHYHIYTQDSRANEVTLNVLNTTIGNLSSELSLEIADKLKNLRESSREGDLLNAFEGVKDLRQSKNWDAFEPPLRASILRVLASMTLGINGKNDLHNAREWANEAKKIFATQDDATLELRIKILEKGFESIVEERLIFQNTESYNLWLNCLLNTRRFDVVLSSREAPPTGIILNAETRRFYALALLASKELLKAREEIKIALEESPKWYYVRFTAAIIDYFSALSPSVLQPGLTAFPPPVFLNWVKIDDESQEKLARAASELLFLLNQFKKGSREYNELQVWYFACLANLLTKQKEAVNLGEQILKDNPAHLQILSWFLSRYVFDFQESLDLLRKKEEETRASLGEIIALVGIYIRLEKPNLAMTVIDRTFGIFESAGETNLWRYWRIEILLNLADYSAAVEELDQLNDPELKPLSQTHILNFKGETSGDWKPLIQFLRKRKNEDTDSFLSLYEIKSQKTIDEKFLFKYADRYCELMETAFGVEFVVNALWNIKRPLKSLDLLIKYESFFPKGKLPAHLRRLKIHCLRFNDIKGAVVEAEQLAVEENSVENLSLLMDVQLVKGDLTGLHATSRKFLQRNDLTTSDLLRAAHLVQIKDSNLAKKFWLKAIDLGIPSDNLELTAFAQTIASKLGLEDESRNLMRELISQAHEGKGPLKMMRISEMLKLMQKRSKVLNEIDSKYKTGELPLHLWAKERNISLVELIYNIADKNKQKPDIKSGFSLFTRHGARTIHPYDDFTNSKQWNLHLDITSLLLANKLNILDKLEGLFKPLKISRHAITSLIEQRDNLRPHQKAQLDNSRVVDDLFNRTKLKLSEEESPEEILSNIRQLVKEFKIQQGAKRVSKIKGKRNVKKKNIVIADPSILNEQMGDRLDTLAQAISGDGFAVGLLPLTCYNTSGYSVLRLPETLSNLIFNCRAVIDSLRGTNRISQEKYQYVLEAIGQEGVLQSRISPLPQSKLFLMSGVEDVLAQAGILETVCENFVVIISPSILNEARNRISHYENLDKLGMSVDALIDRINIGIDEGVYEFIQISDERRKSATSEKEDFDQNTKSSLDLLLFEPKEWDMVCIDDRALTKYAFRRENGRIVPTISINELLLALRKNDEIDDQQYYKCLLELRSSNFRYIPITADEVLFHLSSAQAKDGRVVETEALSILRKYYASCLLDKEFLQIVDNDQFSEVPFIVYGVESIADALVYSWKNAETNPRLAAERADWILNSLYTGNLGCLHLRNKTALEKGMFSDSKTLAIDVCNLLMRGLFLTEYPLMQDGREDRKLYFKWLEDRILSSRCVSEPNVIKSIADEVKQRLTLAFNPFSESSEQKTLAGFMMGRFFIDLPEIVKNELYLDPEMKEWMRIKYSVVIDGIVFEPNAYWKAVEKALEGDKSSITVADSNVEYYLTQETSDEGNASDLFPTIEILDSKGSQIAIVQDPAFVVLDTNLSKRKKNIRSIREWFDCDEIEFKRIIDSISNTKDLSTRAAYLHQTQEASIVCFYRDLECKLRSRNLISWRELTPRSIENLAGYYRLPVCLGEKTFVEVREESAIKLLREEGLERAIARLGILPIALPNSVVKQYVALSDDKKLDLLKSLTSLWVSPLRLLHVAYLGTISFTTNSSKFQPFVQEILGRLYDSSEDGSEFAAFKSTLTFASDEIALLKSSEVSPEIALAVIWGHANELYHVQRVVGLLPAYISGAFWSKLSNHLLEGLSRDSATWFDCLQPNRVSRTEFLTHVIANLFQNFSEETLKLIGLPDLIKREALRQTDDGPQLAFHLYKDPTLYENNLKSLFGGDRSDLLTNILSTEGIEVPSSTMSRENLQAFYEELIKDPEKVKVWILVYLIGNDLPVDADLRKLARRALRNFSYYALFQEEIDDPSFILSVACSQVSNLNDKSLRADFRNHLLSMVKAFAADQGTDKESETLEKLAYLLESAVALSYIPGDPVQSNKELVSLLDAIDMIWSGLRANLVSSILNIVWDTPLEQSQPWWLLNLKIRTN